MCGIAGIVSWREADVQPAVAKMTVRLAHRGPDSSGVWAAAGVAMGHARLSIIDLSEAGGQPMCSHGGSHIIVFNGEVYNFAEIRTELETQGHRFCGHSDTEVVVNAFEAWGPACFSRFNGIFGLAVWDIRARELFLARDRFGAKPLYYSVGKVGGPVAFASEIAALRASGQVSNTVREDRIHEFLYYGSVSCNATMYTEVERVPPGHYLRFRAGAAPELAPYWLPEQLGHFSGDYREAVTETGRLLEQAVRRQLVADVPVGVFLSGGIDSSALTAFASRHYSGKLNSYSVGFDYEKGVNELPKARAVAEHFGTEHHELQVSSAGLPGVLETLVSRHDEPFSDAANIPLYLLCREIQGDVKVVLQGDGGDEFFAGYRRYDLLDRFRLWHGAARVAGALGWSGPARLRRIFEAFGMSDDGMRMALLMTMELREPSPLRVLTPALRARVALQDPFASYGAMNRRFAALDRVQRMLYTDTQMILPDIFLEKVDKATMACGVEARVPFLDNDLTAFAMSLPSRFKVGGGEKKRLLRAALRGVVPDFVLNGPKTGFGVPYAHWLRTTLHAHALDVVMESASGPDAVFDSVTMRSLFAELKRDGSHGFLLWKCYQFALWRRLSR